MEILVIAYIGLIGLLIGSFLNVVIYRLPHSETIIHGRSHCPVCRHTLNALDLVPVFSFLFLGRRCRYCKAPISWRYMIIELITSIFFVSAAIAYPPLDGLVSLVMMAASCALFSILLADSMIQYDGHPTQSKTMTPIALVLAFVPLLTGLLLDMPEFIRLVDRAAGLSAGLLVFLLPLVIIPMRRQRLCSNIPLAIGLPVAGLFLGFHASLPVLAAGIILSLALIAWPSQKQESQASVWLCRLLPLLVLLAFTVTNLFD